MTNYLLAPAHRMSQGNGPEIVLRIPSSCVIEYSAVVKGNDMYAQRSPRRWMCASMITIGKWRSVIKLGGEICCIVDPITSKIMQIIVLKKKEQTKRVHHIDSDVRQFVHQKCDRGCLSNADIDVSHDRGH